MQKRRRQFGCTEQQLRQAVSAVGDSAAKVGQYPQEQIHAAPGEGAEVRIMNITDTHDNHDTRGGAGPADASPTSANAARAISREDMAQLPIRRYEGEVLLVATAQDLQRALADLAQESIVGFDTETRPAFRKGEHHLPCLFQAATARAVYVFPLRHRESFHGLARLLSEPGIVKAGIALAHDLRALKQVFPFDEKNTVDLGIVARRRGLEQTGLRNLAGIFLG